MEISDHEFLALCGTKGAFRRELRDPSGRYRLAARFPRDFPDRPLCKICWTQKAETIKDMLLAGEAVNSTAAKAGFAWVCGQTTTVSKAYRAEVEYRRQK
jgi:hypothetical protein